jgi:outer membrane protein OmpA-like peptidoglycan-associated protein
MCRSELSAAKIVLTESLTTEQRRLASTMIAAEPRVDAVPVAPKRGAATSEPNHIFVVNFALGSADFSISPVQRSQLIEQARAAKLILIRGRTDATADSMSETRLAQRRAEAAYKYLVDLVRLPPEGFRLSWQGAGDPLQGGTTAADRGGNRRVEIELYQAMPELQLEPLPRDPPRESGVAGLL